MSAVHCIPPAPFSLLRTELRLHYLYAFLSLTHTLSLLSLSFFSLGQQERISSSRDFIIHTVQYRQGIREARRGSGAAGSPALMRMRRRR